MVIVPKAAGAKGKRFAMPSTRIMMHQPAGGAMGSADEVNIQASELNRTMKVPYCSIPVAIASQATCCPLTPGSLFEKVPRSVQFCARQVIHQFYVEFTGQSLEKVQEETDRDNFMSPQQAMDLGLIDGVIR